MQVRDNFHVLVRSFKDRSLITRATFVNARTSGVHDGIILQATNMTGYSVPCTFLLLFNTDFIYNLSPQYSTPKCQAIPTETSGLYEKNHPRKCLVLRSDLKQAGATAAFTVDLLVYPLDTLKTRWQSPDYTRRFIDSSANAVNKRALFRGLYQGLGSVIIATLPSCTSFSMRRVNQTRPNPLQRERFSLHMKE